LLARKGVLTFGLQVGQVAVLVGLNVLITRVTGASGKGVFTLMSLLVTLSASMMSLGVNWAAIYFVGRKVFPLRDLTATVLASTLVSSVVAIAVISAAFVLLRHSYFHAITNAELLVTLTLVPIVQLATSVGMIVLGSNRPLHFAGLSLTQWTVTFAIQAGMAFTGHLEPFTALIAWAIGAFVSLVLGLRLLAIDGALAVGFKRDVLRALLGFGIKGYAANLLMFFNYRLDSLIVNGLVGVASLGIYSIAVALAEVIWYVAGAIGTVMFPHISSVERREADRLTPIVCRNVWFITLVGVVAMFAVSHWLILFAFGPAMLPAMVPLWLLLPGILTLSGAKVIASYLSGIGRPEYATGIAAGTVVLTIALDFILIPRFGIAGAAAASSFVYTVAAAVSVYALVRESHARVLDIILIQPQDIAYYRRAARATASWLGVATAVKS
jgi:O-antigen/teichoic acid export membrane protein